VFVIRRQQVDMPNHCSSSNFLFINFDGIAAPAMPFGCSALLRSLSYSLQFLLIPHGSSHVLHPASFIRSSFRFITPRSQPINLLNGLAHTTCHTEPVEVCAQPLSQGPGCPTELGEVLTGFHFTAFIATLFQQGSVHPLPSFLMLAGGPSSGCVHPNDCYLLMS
jgi:hypothetical protein